MEKINGYAKSEAEELIGYIAEGRRAGKTLTSLFAGYGRAHGRAGGSVRNYYYRLLKTDSPAARGILAGTRLRAETVQPFTAAEKEEMLRLILTERGKGVSVRRAIANVCGGDEKKMLRYQNKYRNMLKKQPEEVRAAAVRLGLGEAPPSRPPRLLERRLEGEIDALCERIALALRQENARLREENGRLRAEGEAEKAARVALQEQLSRLAEENDILRRAASGADGADEGAPGGA